MTESTRERMEAALREAAHEEERGNGNTIEVVSLDEAIQIARAVLPPSVAEPDVREEQRVQRMDVLLAASAPNYGSELALSEKELRAALEKSQYYVSNPHWVSELLAALNETLDRGHPLQPARAVAEPDAMQKRLRILIEEAGVILAEEELFCKCKHIGTFKKLSAIRDELLRAVAEKAPAPLWDDAEIKAIAERCTARFLRLEHRLFEKQGKKIGKEQIDAGLRIIAVEDVIVQEIKSSWPAAEKAAPAAPPRQIPCIHGSIGPCPHCRNASPIQGDGMALAGVAQEAPKGGVAMKSNVPAFDPTQESGAHGADAEQTSAASPLNADEIVEACAAQAMEIYDRNRAPLNLIHRITNGILALKGKFSLAAPQVREET